MAKLVFLGDSLTWGGFGGNFVPPLAERLPAHEIINAGEGGDTVLNLQQRVDDVLGAVQPDAMFVMVGGNDAVSYHMPETRPYYRSSKGIDDGFVSPEDYEAAYRDLLVHLQLNFVQPFVGLPPTEYSRELVAAQRDYNCRARRVAEALNIPVLDLAARYMPDQPIEREGVSLRFIQQIGKRYRQGWRDYEEERQRWGYTYTFDGMHLLPESAQSFAEVIAKFLQKHL